MTSFRTYSPFALALTLLVGLAACTTTDLQRLGTLLNTPLTTADIVAGLKEALKVGINKGADRLATTDGYFRSQYKIQLPPEARQIADRLKVVPGFANVEETILEKINRGAEDAATRAKPIFVSAITGMTVNDAMGILKGNQDAATQYLRSATYNQLYQEFNPVIIQSLDKFNARQYWTDAVTAYNRIPLVTKANPSLDDYVTTQALSGLFGMVAQEEANIRTNISARTSDLMRRVFAEQDK